VAAAGASLKPPWCLQAAHWRSRSGAALTPAEFAHPRAGGPRRVAAFFAYFLEGAQLNVSAVVASTTGE